MTLHTRILVKDHLTGLQALPGMKLVNIKIPKSHQPEHLPLKHKFIHLLWRPKTYAVVYIKVCKLPTILTLLQLKSKTVDNWCNCLLDREINFQGQFSSQSICTKANKHKHNKQKKNIRECSLWFQTYLFSSSILRNSNQSYGSHLQRLPSVFLTGVLD